MKKMMAFLCAGVALVFLAQTVVADDTVKRRQIYTEKQTFRAPVVMNDKVTYGAEADIATDRRALFPRNYISNSLLGVWSGGSRWGVGGLASVPDGWIITGEYAGVTRVDLADVAFGTGATIYAGFPHSMQVANWNATTGAGTTAYLSFPAEAGVSVAASWYHQFTGKRVVFGAWVRRDLGQYAGTGVTTNFIRPYIMTYGGGAAHLTGETSFAFGPYQAYNGWQMVSAVTTVPNAATALEVGFALNPTVLAAAATGGDTAYVCAPFLLVDPVSTTYVPIPQEVIYFDNSVAFQANGSTFDKGAGTSSFTVATETAGKISPNVSALLVGVAGDAAGVLNQIQFRKDTSDLSGLTYWANGSAGATPFTIREWVRTDSNGDFDLYTSGLVNGVSIFVNGAKMRW